MKRLLIALAALLMAGPAFAIDEWTACGTDTAFTGGSPPSVTQNGCIEYRYSSATLAATDLTVRVSADYAILHFDSDTLSASAGAATLTPKGCPASYAQSDLLCQPIVASAMTGGGGAAATQSFQIRIPRGNYQLEITAAATGSQRPLIQIWGEN